MEKKIRHAFRSDEIGRARMKWISFFSIRNWHPRAVGKPPIFRNPDFFFSFTLRSALSPIRRMISFRTEISICCVFSASMRTFTMAILWPIQSVRYAGYATAKRCQEDSWKDFNPGKKTTTAFWVFNKSISFQFKINKPHSGAHHSRTQALMQTQCCKHKLAANEFEFKILMATEWLQSIFFSKHRTNGGALSV